MYKYGLDNEMNYESNDDGTMMWYSGNNQNNGVPRTIKSGVYYVDKISKKTKLNFNYTYANNRLIAKSETRTQYFLNDTSYVTNNELESKQTTESHTINFGVVQTIDSLTELQIKPKLVLNSNNTTSTSINKFITSTDTLTRTNTIENNNKASGYEAAVIAIFNRKFKKKDRLFVATLNANFKNNNADAILQSVNVFYTNLFFPNNDINQNKINKSESNSYNAKLVYTEPLTKKIKVEVEYVFNQTKNHQSKKTYNYFNGDYSLSDSLFTNDFNNTTMFNRAGAKFIYESKKTRFAVGSRYQLNNLSNQNLITNKSINYNTSAILPFVSYNYRFSENTRFNIGYYSFVNQPSVNQLQPVPDNTNPNRVILGNASLKPSYNNTIEMWFNTWKPISGRNVWANASYNIVNNAFANSTTFDSIGRTISQTVNVNDNSNGNFYIGGGLPFFQKLLELYGNANGSYSSYSNFVNNQKNKTTAKSLSLGLSLQIQADTIEFSIGADYTWNYTQSTLNAASNKPYGNQSYNAAVRFKLPYKFTLESEANYNILTKREQGYNINYLVWNAALRKSFFKNETLIISIEAYDLLNQNISTNRTIQDNTITDNRTTIINQYFLLRAVFKFNSNKTKDNEEEW
jgi:outer membrane receptor protein involved in Fe transport